MKMKNISIIKFVLFFHQILMSTVKWIKQLLIVCVCEKYRKEKCLSCTDNRVTGKRLKCSL